MFWKIYIYIMTELVYALFDCILTEFRPGPLGLNTVVESARKIKVSPDAYVRFRLAAVAVLT